MRGVVCVLLLLFAFNLRAQNTSSDTVVTIGKIYITGQKKTKLEIIQRELDFQEGQQISKKELLEVIELDKQKLVNTRLFVIVDIIPLTISNTEVDVLIRLQERWYIFPAPIFRIADRNFTEWIRNQGADFSRVNYGLQLYHFNLTGRNDRLAAIAQFGFTNRYQLQYQIPYINKKQTLGLLVSTGFNNNKTIAYNTIDHRLRFVEQDNFIRKTFFTSSALTFRPSFFSRHSLNIAYSRTTIADTVRTLNPSYLLDGKNQQQYVRASYIYSWDKRDYFAYPLSGKLYRLEVNKYGLGLFDDLDMLTIRASYGQYFDLGKNFYLGNRMTIQYNFNEDVPYLNRSGFGYRPDFIRGYERNVVEGRFMAANRSSFKWKFFSGVKQLYKNSFIEQFRTMPFAFYLKAFVDLGYVGQPLPHINGNFLNQQLLSGIGIGLDVQTYYDFVVRFEYSVNEDGQGGFFINFRSAL